MRRCHSDSATRSSRRARCEPRQRWIPLPKARWRLTSPVEADVERIGELLGIDVGRRQVGHHEVAGTDGVLADVGGPRVPSG